MVLYSSVTADLSNVCIEILEGTIPEKILYLQVKLEQSYPDVIVQSVNDQDPIQLKGSWDDIKNVHVFLESWLKCTSEGELLCEVKDDPELEFEKSEPKSGTKKSGQTKVAQTKKGIY